MLLNAVDAINSRGSMLSLPFADSSTGFVVRSIEGLGPVKATLVSTSFANGDGEQYHSARREVRDINIQLGLEPDWAVNDIQDLRDQLYDYFMPKTEVILGFHMDKRVSESTIVQRRDVQISARIEDFSSVLFTSDPVVDISMRCFDPDFYDPIPVVVDGLTVSDLTETILTYTGTVETGLEFTLSPNQSASEFAIYLRAPDGSTRTVNFTYPLLAGDVLKISSIPGSKYAKLTRAGVESSVLYGISPESAWLELEPGDNVLRVYYTGTPMPWSIDYTTKYGGL